VVRIDPATDTASLVATIRIPTPIYSQTQGDLQLLPDGNWWIGWGNVNQSSEVSAAGKQLFEAQTPNGSESYRSLRFPWSATPATAPSAAVVAARGDMLRVYLSWNGATDVAGWRLEAGTSAGTLAPVLTARSGGFETVLRLPDSVRFVAAEALDANGRVLARSPVLACPVAAA
jgi:hypothetical protein